LTGSAEPMEKNQMELGQSYGLLWGQTIRGLTAMAGEPADDELVAQVRAGDQEAFGTLLHRYQDKVYSVVYHYVEQPEDALDLTQEAFVKAYAQLGGFRGQSSFYTWLYRIAVNVAIDAVRKRATRKALSVEQAETTGLQLASSEREPDPQQALEAQELSAVLRATLAKLSPALRATVIMHDVEGMTHEEIGHVLGCSEGTAKSRLSRARAELRRRLQGRL
jgi:RNA polymerase sigma-70 factor (ECF subfamily)